MIFLGNVIVTPPFKMRCFQGTQSVLLSLMQLHHVPSYLIQTTPSHSVYDPF
jgi:hypothetical protein